MGVLQVLQLWAKLLDIGGSMNHGVGHSPTLQFSIFYIRGGFTSGCSQNRICLSPGSVDGS